MNCQECGKRLSEYFDNDLNEQEAREIKAHLESCESCRKQLRQMEQLAGAIQDMPRHEPSVACLLRISKMIHRHAIPSCRTTFGPVLNYEELAAYLRVDQKTIGQYLDEIPSFELGGKLLFRKKSVEEWIESKETGFRLQRTEDTIEDFSGYRGYTLDADTTLCPQLFENN